MAFKNIVCLFKLESLILYRATKIFHTEGRFISDFELFAKSLILYSECFMRKIEYSLFVTKLFYFFYIYLDALLFSDSDSDNDNILYEIL